MVTYLCLCTCNIKKLCPPHKCILCEKTKVEWSGKHDCSNNKNKNALTLEEKVVGKICHIDDRNFLIPLLHMLIGTANYQILKKHIPYIMTLEPLSKEIVLKKELLELLHNVDKYTCADIEMNIVECKTKLSRAGCDLPLAQRKLDRFVKTIRSRKESPFLETLVVSYMPNLQWT